MKHTSKSEFDVKMTGHVRATEYDTCPDTGAILFNTGKMRLDKKNAIHPQNMARIIARALSNEPNGYIHRIAFGNGGTVTDPAGNVIFNPTNDGRNGSWESRLYNETYSEIVDELHPDFGSDPGSAEPGNIRTGGGSVPEDDPEGGGVTSVEVGTKSNIVISMFINQNEPTGQFLTINDFGIAVDEEETTFVFDEIGLYSPGKQATETSGHTSLTVGNKTSSDNTLLEVDTDYELLINVDGSGYTVNIHTPVSGTGTAGLLTYGDLCEGLNTGDWITGGDDFTLYAIVYITDHSGGTYPTITNKESYGMLTFESLTSGTLSSVALECPIEVENNNILAALTNGLCDENANVNQVAGDGAGVLNDTIDPTQERERLLTHIVFPPITKTADKALNIVYTITVSVSRTTDSRVVQTTL